MPAQVCAVVNYNGYQDAIECLHPLKAQTGVDRMPLVIDNASHIGSAAHVRAAHPDVEVVETERSPGFAGGNNIGIERALAQSEYVWIAKADDYSDPRFLEMLVSKSDAHPCVSIAHCQSSIVDEHNSIKFLASKWTQPLSTTRWKADYVNNERDECSNYLVQDCTVPNASAVLFRKSAYKQAGAANEAIRASGDWFLYANIMLVSDVAFVSEPLNYFRQHSLSTTHASGWNGLLIEEGYQVVAFIAGKVKVDTQAPHAPCKKRMGDWRQVLLSGRSCIPWQRNIAIYRIARRVDPILHLRLAKLPLLLVMRALLPRVHAANMPAYMTGSTE